MQMIVIPSEKRAVKTLFTDEPVQIPSVAQGEYLDLEIYIADRIANPTTSRLFEPRDASAYTVKAAIGNAWLLPVAGTFYLRVGATLTSGTVTNAKRFEITTFVAGDDFTNIGAASNASGVVFTATGTTPTTWTNSSQVREVTANLDFDCTSAAMETALNATASITADGGVTVTGTDGFFVVTWAATGSRAAITGYGGGLAPLSLIDVGTLIDGSTSYAESQTVRVIQNPGAYLLLPNATAAVAGTPVVLTTGGSGANHKIRITLTPNPFDGSFTITVASLESALLSYNATAAEVLAALEGISSTSGTLVSGRKYKIVTFVTGDNFTNVGAGSNATGVVFTASGTTPTTWTNGSTLSPVASGNVEVVKEATSQWLISFIGDMANTAMGTIATDVSSVRVLEGRSGTLDCGTAALGLLMGDDDSITTKFELKVTPGGGSEGVYLQNSVDVIASIIPPSSGSPVPSSGIVDGVTGTAYRVVINDGVIGIEAL